MIDGNNNINYCGCDLMEKLLSIIIPVYNGEKFINNALNSVFNCKRNDYEIIVVNDGSTDKTAEICKNYKDYSQFTAYNLKNGGVSSARNFGIEKAKGKYVTFLDVDDEYFENSLEKAMNNLENHMVDLIMFPYSITNEQGEILSDVDIFADEEPSLKEVFLTFSNSSNMNYCWGKFYNRDYIIRNNVKFDTDLAIGEDVEFEVEFFKSNPTIFYDKVRLVKYRQNDSSVMHSYDYRRFDDLERSLRLCEYALSKFDYNKSEKESMYSHHGVLLMSYIKNISGTKPRKEFVQVLNKYLERNPINNLIKNLPLNKMGFVKKTVGKLLQKHSYNLVVFMFGFIK